MISPKVSVDRDQETASSARSWLPPPSGSSMRSPWRSRPSRDRLRPIVRTSTYRIGDASHRKPTRWPCGSASVGRSTCEPGELHWIPQGR